MRGWVVFPIWVVSLVLVTAAELTATVPSVPQQGPWPFPRIEPYISISVTPQQLDLGAVPQPGLYDSPATLTLHVEANCPQGGVVVHATPLVCPKAQPILPDRIFVRIPKTGEYVPMKGPVNITGPMGPGVFDFDLNFRVNTELQDQPGRYTGMFVFTFMGDGP